ncbi:hypothetical protein ES703_77113 [subsurface metagenome]
MIGWLIRLLRKRELKKAWGKGYDTGVSKGYELGYLMGRAESKKQGVIIGGTPSTVAEKEVDDILRKKEF